MNNNSQTTWLDILPPLDEKIFENGAVPHCRLGLHFFYTYLTYF